jgi:two-component system sensor histidine kinase KdpD
MVIAAKALELFRARAVRVNVSSFSGEEEIRLLVPLDRPVPSGDPTLTILLETARGVLGDIQVWLEEPVDDPSKERLIRTFAYQGALALERTAFALSETRARVLEESDRLKTAILSSVSHELRTPLATIKAAITSLLNEQVSWEKQARQDLLSAVDEETDLLNRLVGNLLDMSRIETGALKPNRQWNLLAEIVDGVVQRMYRTLKDHRVKVDIPDDLPLVPVDYVQLEQVFMNLFSNSAKYAPSGSLIQVLAARQGNDQLLVQVTNEGPQIAPGHLERIFDKFYRLTNAEHVSGTGLGLSICKGIVEAHGGEIWVENTTHGIAFKFTLPLLMDGVRPPVIEAETFG